MSTRICCRLQYLFLFLAALLAYSSFPKELRYVRLSLRVSSGQPVLVPEGLRDLEAMRAEVATSVLHGESSPDIENLKSSWKLQQGLVVRVGGPNPVDMARRMQDHFRNQWLARLDELGLLHQEAHRSAALTARTLWQARFQASDPEALKARQNDIKERLRVLEWRIRQPGASVRGRSQEEADMLRSGEALRRDDLKARMAKLESQLLRPAQLLQAELEFRGEPVDPFVMPRFERLEVELMDRQPRWTYLPGPQWPSALGLGLLMVAAILTFHRCGLEQDLASRIDPAQHMLQVPSGLA